MATTSGPHANLYDLSAFLNGAEDYGFIGQVPWPSTAMDSPYGSMVGYHDFYVAWEPESGRDILYGSGLDGYYIYDITDLDNPELITSIVGVMGVTIAHTLTATPDAKIGVGQTEYKYSPIRIYDLEQGIHGGKKRITSELSAWTRNYKALSHNNEMRYPYVFVSSYKDGIDIFDISDPENPEGVAYYDTYFGPEKAGLANGSRSDHRQPGRGKRLQRRLRHRRPEPRRPHRGDRHGHRPVAHEDGWIRRLARRRPRDAEHSRACRTGITGRRAWFRRAFATVVRYSVTGSIFGRRGGFTLLGVGPSLLLGFVLAGVPAASRRRSRERRWRRPRGSFPISRFRTSSRCSRRWETRGRPGWPT